MSARQQRATARLAAVQALYQMDVAAKGINEILSEFETYWIGGEIDGVQYAEADRDLFRAIVQGVLADQQLIDRKADHVLQDGWPLRRVEAVMRAVLRAGVYELMREARTPAKVIITQYVDVAAAFLADSEVGMTNAVLDRLAREIRPDDFQSRA